MTTNEVNHRRPLSGMRAGFTIVEIILAIGLVLGLMAILYPMVMRRQEQGRRKTVKLEMQQFRIDVERYYDDTGSYPNEWRDLINRPSGEGAEKWDGPYLDKKMKSAPKDPWQKQYQYKKNPDGDGFEICSFGGKEGKKIPKSEWVCVRS